MSELAVIDWRLLGRISSKVVETTGDCWAWTGAGVKDDGYGRIRVQGRTLLAHRVAFEAFAGAIPKGLQLDHLCRNRACVNPDHLEPVTQQENIARGEAGAYLRARTHCPRGHAYDEKNTARQSGNGGRRCRACHVIQTTERRRQRARFNREGSA